MNRQDLINYKNDEIWIKDQIDYIKEQKETINQLNSILSDMPRGSRKIYDTEAENIAKLEDCFNKLMDVIVEQEEKQKEIVAIVNKLEYPYKNILFKAYIQGKKLVTVASELGYEYKYTCKVHGTALDRFDRTTKEVERRYQSMF